MHAVVPRMSGSPGGLRNPAPAVGEHNDEIYARIGYPRERIQALAKKDVI
jgi:crotonobetainyl-CoA:carnitine CoA-transferase CaiB-like acyl-CoA transferase